MPCTVYIQVILPLKLGWEPFYSLPEGEEVCIGDRVLAPFAGRSYLGVVSAVNVCPPQDIRRIIPIYGKHTGKAQISENEIELWRKLSLYYMCSVGEVYKAAYPYVKDETVTPRKKAESTQEPKCNPELSEQEQQAYGKVQAALKAKQNVLLKAGSSEELLAQLCRDTEGCILWLVPETKFGHALQEKLTSLLGSRLLVWNSNITPAGKRKVLQKCRMGETAVILGTRSAVFLPFKHLELVIVQEEHEVSYKQRDPAPHYNGRDAALVLAAVHKAAAVLQSATPSLESIFNSRCGKLYEVCIPHPESAEIEVIDTRSELRKNGMEGDLSKKLIQALDKSGHGVIFKSKRSAFPDLEQLKKGVKEHFDEKVCIVDDLIEQAIPENTDTIGILGIDALLGKGDFRADEKAVQTISPVVRTKGLKKVLIQTNNAYHPALQAIIGNDCNAMLQERQKYSLPPFTRLVDIQLKDDNIQRATVMENKLSVSLNSAGFNCLPGSRVIRISLQKNKNLPTCKKTILQLVDRFEKENHYAGFISFDVDPL